MDLSVILIHFIRIFVKPYVLLLDLRAELSHGAYILHMGCNSLLVFLKLKVLLVILDLLLLYFFVEIVGRLGIGLDCVLKLAYFDLICIDLTAEACFLRVQEVILP